MTIRKILQKIFKKSFHLIFKVFYGKINISRDLKTINFKKIEVRNIKIDKTSSIGLTKNIIFMLGSKCFFINFKLPIVPAGPRSIIYL